MLAVQFKALNLLFTTHPINSDCGKLPTVILAYNISSMSVIYFSRYSQYYISDYHHVKRIYMFINLVYTYHRYRMNNDIYVGIFITIEYFSFHRRDSNKTQHEMSPFRVEFMLYT